MTQLDRILHEIRRSTGVKLNIKINGMERNNWKTYKINLTDEQEEFLRQKKMNEGTSLGWQLTQAVKQYIDNERKNERSI
jgi:hypothetical protein